jgi:hypothetical protein
VQPYPLASQTVDSPKQIENIYSKNDSLSYADYEIVKLNKKVRLEQTPNLTEVSYAILRRNGRTLATFDGAFSGFGNATDFGLVSLLGGETKQLVVSQTIPRGGRHWIVGLSPDFRVLFDSNDYGVGREEIGIVDIDENGTYEISQVVTAFYGFENLSSAATPLPEIIFRYDESARKYFPANQYFQNYMLKGIEQEVVNLKAREGEEYLSRILDITLRYMYTGKEEEAWSFFNKEYRLQNKEELKAKIQAVLKNEAIYRFIYRRGAIKLSR